MFEKGQKVAAKSFQVGTVRILKGKANPEIWSEIKEWLHKNVDESIEHTYFATGGNINKVHKMVGAKQADPLSVSKMITLRNNLNKLTVNQRVDLYQLKPDRADVIIPACDIYIYIFKELNVKEFVVPKIGLSDGMIYDMYLKYINDTN